MLDGEVGFIDVYSPASAWTLNETYAEATLPKEQTPLANSVDPKAHILKCSAAPVSGGSVKLSHEFAYGKMSVATPEGFVIDRVEVLFEGSFSGTARKQELTLYADNVENNEFWFATQPMTVESFTVTAYDANDKAYTKSVNVSESSNTLVFSDNKVKTFGVKDLVAEDIETEEPDESEDINAPAFTEAFTSGSYYGDFYLNFLDDTLGVLTLNTYLMATSDWTLIEGTYGFAENVSAGTPSIYAFYSTYKGTSLYGGTVKISIVNNQYEIYFSNLTDQKGNILLASAKYIGVIEGLLPNGGGDEPGGGEEPEQPGGGDEPVQPENPSNADGKTLETAYTFTTYTKQDDWGYPVMCLSGSEDNAVFEFESNNQSGYPTGLNAFNSGGWYTNWLKYEVNGTLIHCTYGPNQPSAINWSESYTWLERGGSGYTVEYIKIVLNNSDNVWYKFDGSFAF